jgi:hypothetical protein
VFERQCSNPDKSINISLGAIPNELVGPVEKYLACILEMLLRSDWQAENHG